MNRSMTPAEKEGNHASNMYNPDIPGRSSTASRPACSAEIRTISDLHFDDQCDDARGAGGENEDPEQAKTPPAIGLGHFPEFQPRC